MISWFRAQPWKSARSEFESSLDHNLAVQVWTKCLSCLYGSILFAKWNTIMESLPYKIIVKVKYNPTMKHSTASPQKCELWSFRNINRKKCNISSIAGLGLMTACGRKHHLAWRVRKAFKNEVTLYHSIRCPWIKERYQVFEGWLIFQAERMEKASLIFMDFALFPLKTEGLKAYLIVYLFIQQTFIHYRLCVLSHSAFKTTTRITAFTRPLNQKQVTFKVTNLTSKFISSIPATSFHCGFCLFLYCLYLKNPVFYAINSLFIMLCSFFKLKGLSFWDAFQHSSLEEDKPVTIFPLYSVYSSLIPLITQYSNWWFPVTTPLLN